MKLRLGIPKGSLQEATLSLFARPGCEFIPARALTSLRPMIRKSNACSFVRRKWLAMSNTVRWMQA